MINRSIRSILLLMLLLGLIASGILYYQRSAQPSNIEPSANDSVTELPIDLSKEETSSDEIVEETSVVDDTPVVVEPIESKKVLDYYQTIINIYLSNENVNSMIQDAYDITANDGSRVNNGVVALTDLGITFSDLDLAVTVDTITYTTVETTDGSTVIYIESGDSVPQMYVENSIDNLEAVVINNEDSTISVVKKGEEEFDDYSSNLLKQKDAIRYDKLTNLDRLLEGTELVRSGSSYHTITGNKSADFEVYSGSNKIVILDTDAKYNYTLVFVDIDSDNTTDHQYMIEKKGLMNINFETSDFQNLYTNSILNGESGNKEYTYQYNQ